MNGPVKIGLLVQAALIRAVIRLEQLRTDYSQDGSCGVRHAGNKSGNDEDVVFPAVG